jgi:integrase/recombinase XerD
MKEDLMAQPPRVRMTGPLAPHQDALRSELLARGYAPLSAQNLIRVAAHLSRWLEEVRRSPLDLTAACLEEFLQHRRACGYAQWLTRKGLAPILDVLRIRGVVPPAEPAPVDHSPAGQILRGFERYLLEERGIQPLTAAGYIRWVKPFVEGLDLSELERLSADMVSRFILHEARSSGIGYLKLKVCSLRSFLRYLHVERRCCDLSAAVPAVAGYRLSGIPRAIPEEDVRRIERSCDRGRATGRRDYAILLLFSRLGLRAAEIAALNLNDVRWARGEIVIRGKGSEGVLPLPQELGEALADYLKGGRPTTTSRRLFRQVVAPHGDLSPGAVKEVMRSACRRAGLTPMGPHRLRHTAATVMLRKGTSLPDIAQVLRHGSLLTTTIYAKVDDRALRPLARPWPGGAA